MDPAAITQDELEMLVLEQLFQLANWNTTPCTSVELAKLTELPVPRIDMALKSLSSRDLVGYVTGARQLRYRITDEGYRLQESKRKRQQYDDVDIKIPASDRIVTLNHNQIAEADAPISNLIEELEADNGNPEIPGLRERLLGQIKAARELLRAGEYKVYLMYELLVRSLGELIKRYENPAIQALANALLGAVVSQLLQVK